MPRLRITFGQNLRKYRKQKGWSQEKLAEKAKISVDFVSLIERGINAPSFENIEKLAKALQTKISNFFY